MCWMQGVFTLTTEKHAHDDHLHSQVQDSPYPGNLNNLSIIEVFRIKSHSLKFTPSKLDFFFHFNCNFGVKITIFLLQNIFKT
jgi:hypothetical protein